ncbi:hypothetical protein KY289_003296 [Solanum tuberosum]|nr:hypothetical protein KY289_003296 [Solanum tuberosum]
MTMRGWADWLVEKCTKLSATFLFTLFVRWGSWKVDKAIKNIWIWCLLKSKRDYLGIPSGGGFNPVWGLISRSSLHLPFLKPRKHDFKYEGRPANDDRLRTAVEASQRSTKEDWAKWLRHFSIELLKESPSPALRTCSRLAQLQAELFAAGFVSCWSQLNEASQRQLVRSLQMVFSSPNIPPEILATLLNLDSPSIFPVIEMPLERVEVLRALQRTH